MASGRRSRGQALQRGLPVLQKISEYFATTSEVVALAVNLLSGEKLPTGGKTFVDGLSGTPAEKAHAVLEKWCSFGGSYGGDLLAVLEQPSVCPTAAMRFQKDLLESSQASGKEKSTSTPERTSSQHTPSGVSRKRKRNDTGCQESKKARQPSTTRQNVHHKSKQIKDTSASQSSSVDHSAEEALQNWRHQNITREHISRLENTSVALKWEQIARRLRTEEPGQPEAFSNTEIAAIKKANHNTDAKCLQVMISSWVDMDLNNTVGPFYDALVKEKLKGAAERIFGVPPS